MSKKKIDRHHLHINSLRELVDSLPARGDKPLFRFSVGKGEYGQLSYTEFHDRVIAAAAGLMAAGLGGKRIGVIGETSPEWVIAYIATVLSGGVIVPLDKELEISEIEGFLSGVEAEAIVFSGSFNKKLQNAMEQHPTLKTFIPIAPSEEMTGDGILPLSVIEQKGKEALAAGLTLPEPEPEKMTIMLFTSGTTGTSKCVMLSEKNLCACVNAACESVDFSDKDVTVSVLPLHHTYELAIMIASLNVGLTVGINDSLRHLLRNFAEYKPTGLVLVPLFVSTMYKKIWDEVKKKGKEQLLRKVIATSNRLRKVGIDMRKVLFKDVVGAFGGRLSKIICGGAALNPEMVKCFDDFGIQICEGYGITECSPLIAVTPYYAPCPGSVGPAVPCCRVRIAATGKNDLGFDEGEIQVKGDNVMLGYYNNDEANAGAFTEDGWYRTGDVGYLDERDYIHITGRLKSVIVLENGKNVFPEEIEEYLANIEEIGEAVVVGRKEQDSDTVVLTAVVYPNRDLFPEGTDKQAVYDAIWARLVELDKTLPSFKKIKALELRDTEFEKTTSRKIRRHLVK